MTRVRARLRLLPPPPPAHARALLPARQVTAWSTNLWDQASMLGANTRQNYIWAGPAVDEEEGTLYVASRACRAQLLFVFFCHLPRGPAACSLS